MIYPIGNKIIVKRLIQDNIKHGIVLKEKGEREGNCWGEIIGLPEVSDNIWIKTMKIGDKVLYKRFQADNSTDVENDEDFQVLNVENQNGQGVGQVLAIEKL